MGAGTDRFFAGGLAEQVHRWGFEAADLWAGGWATPRVTTLASHLVVHASSPHLVGNVLLLLVFGPNVERRVGALRFLAAWLLCGVAGALAFAVALPHEGAPLVGASAAVLGIGALHALALRGQRILVFVWLLVVWVGELPARALLVLFLALDLLALLVFGFGGGRIAVPAHLGGLAAGALLGLWVRRRPAPPAQPVS